MFVRKYPDGYHSDVANLELWFSQRCMNKQQIESIASRFGKRHKPKVVVNRRQIETDDVLYLVDYTSMSCVTLDTKKNRYLLEQNGNYHVYGFLIAKNVVSNRKYAMFVSGSQIIERDLELFRHLVKKELGFNVVFVTDNRHNVSLIANKKDTMLIEVEFGGLKKPVYKELRPQQHYKHGKIVTDVSLRNLIGLYLERLKSCGIKLLGRERINQLIRQEITFNASEYQKPEKQPKVINRVC